MYFEDHQILFCRNEPPDLHQTNYGGAYPPLLPLAGSTLLLLGNSSLQKDLLLDLSFSRHCNIFDHEFVYPKKYLFS